MPWASLGVKGHKVKSACEMQDTQSWVVQTVDKEEGWLESTLVPLVRPKTTLTWSIFFTPIPRPELLASQFCSQRAGSWDAEPASPWVPEEVVERMVPCDNDSLQPCMTTMSHKPIVQKGPSEQELN